MVLLELRHVDVRDVFGEDGELAQGAEAGGDGRLAGDAVEREGRGAGGEEVGSVGKVTWGLSRGGICPRGGGEGVGTK